MPNKPKAGIKIRIPRPAERLILNGLKSLKVSDEAPPSKKPKA